VVICKRGRCAACKARQGGGRGSVCIGSVAIRPRPPGVLLLLMPYIYICVWVGSVKHHLFHSSFWNTANLHTYLCSFLLTPSTRLTHLHRIAPGAQPRTLAFITHATGMKAALSVHTSGRHSWTGRWRNTLPGSLLLQSPWHHALVADLLPIPTGVTVRLTM